jgi:uncharacterized protein
MQAEHRYLRQLALPLLAVVCLSAHADQPALSVSGEARLSTVPDLAEVDLAVVTQADSAAEALAANNTAMKALQAQLREGFSLAEKDIQTSQLSVAPRYERSSTSSGGVKPSGYEVQHALHLTVRDFDRLGELLDVAVRNGANQVRGIGFGTSRRDEMLTAARRGAVADARAKAALYAEAAGRALGCVVSLSEGFSGPEVRMPRMAMAMDAAGSSVPVAAGEVEVAASVQVGFAFAGEGCTDEADD